MHSAAEQTTPQPVYLADYTPYPYWIDRVDLEFELHEEKTIVQAVSHWRRKAETPADTPIFLHGSGLELLELCLDTRPLSDQDCEQTDQGLLLTPPKDEHFCLKITTQIYPQNNTSLNGLYRSAGLFCTQCEAEGFRSITFFPDRPDVTAEYRCRITADKTRYPVLLSNGNRIDSGEDGEQHWVQWHDPFAKPSYLFALVAGDLELLQGDYTSMSGKRISLEFYTEQGQAHKCAHALESLQRAMDWDERTFGLEYDLDRYMVVATGYFNMGAMENKGLNIFNDQYLLCSPDTATDTDYLNIDVVLAHEYFHNWTGNRVTLRDWFQLSLKEGLTVFRDQQYTADTYSASLKRVQAARFIRKVQFPEDASPMAHPVRPKSYIEINNFYTHTIYDKGSEVIRMLHTLIGDAAFKRGMAIYIADNDGTSARVEDFLAAMAQASGQDLSQFALWYRQIGTPKVAVEEHFSGGDYRLKLRQSLAQSSENAELGPLQIPLRIALFDRQGQKVEECLLTLTESEVEHRFENLTEKPLLSINRQFTAPVQIKHKRSEEEAIALFACEDDPCNTYDIAQHILKTAALALYQGDRLPSAGVVAALRSTLTNAHFEPAFLALVFSPPDENDLLSENPHSDILGLYSACVRLCEYLACELEDDLKAVFERTSSDASYAFNAAEMGRRSLHSVCLYWLLLTKKKEYIDLAATAYTNSTNMTDRLAALRALNTTDCPARDEALADFRRRFAQEDLVLDKWYALEASASFAAQNPDRGYDRVRELMQSPDFSLANPNRARALCATFCASNTPGFHRNDGLGYALLSEVILALNGLNPQLAARFCSYFGSWQKHTPERGQHMQEAMQTVLKAEKLSPNVYELITTLKQ